MATFFIGKPPAAELPVFSKDDLLEELQAWATTQDTWQVIYGDKQLWDALLIRTVECEVAYVASPSFNPHEAKKSATYQQVVAIKLCDAQEELDVAACKKVNEWTSSFIVTDNMNGIHKNLDRMTGE